MRKELTPEEYQKRFNDFLKNHEELQGMEWRQCWSKDNRAREQIKPYYFINECGMIFSMYGKTPPNEPLHQFSRGGNPHKPDENPYKFYKICYFDNEKKSKHYNINVENMVGLVFFDKIHFLDKAEIVEYLDKEGFEAFKTKDKDNKPKEFYITTHHEDSNPDNNKASNLQMIVQKQHILLHQKYADGEAGESKRKEFFNNIPKKDFSYIIDAEGEEKRYISPADDDYTKKIDTMQSINQSKSQITVYYNDENFLKNIILNVKNKVNRDFFKKQRIIIIDENEKIQAYSYKSTDDKPILLKNIVSDYDIYVKDEETYISSNNI
jgi:hypothetical protein